MPPKAILAGPLSEGKKHFLRSGKNPKYWDLPPELRQNILKGILLDSVVALRNWSRKETRNHLISKIALTREDYKKFSENLVMSKRDIDDYVGFLYHQDREACATCPKQRVLGADDCRCPAVTRLLPILTSMLLVSKSFREDTLAAYGLVQQMLTESIKSKRVQPSSFKPRCEGHHTPGGMNRPSPPKKGLNDFSRDLIEWCEREIVSHQIVTKQVTVGEVEAETEHEGEGPKTFRICDNGGGSIYCGHRVTILVSVRDEFGKDKPIRVCYMYLNPNDLEDDQSASEGERF
ncbi:hypothetical protein TWF506_009579 [Arthrobotrys conoides]|uniref:Uncharacterized protein n=1 Tax=Arthrobotrys conoides TaxID=74498 RepID=A0AAN8PCM5_9PEZI